MSYRVHVMDSEFTIDADNIPKALAALKKSSRRLGKKRGDIITIQFLLEEIGWDINTDVTGLDGYGDQEGIWQLRWSGTKFTDNAEKVLAILAPFVEKGSHIDIIDWNYKIWRYYFDGNRLVSFPGKIKIRTTLGRVVK